MASGVLNCPKSFNNSGLLFVHTEENGKLKIWDTSTGALKQEFTKNFHLNSLCTCLIWVQTSNVAEHKRKKRRSSTNQSVLESLDVVVLGTTLGNITLYDVATNTAISELEGHSGRINHLTWSVDSNSLYSCSTDKNIIEWDVIKSRIKSKWKIEENISCILALSSCKHLLTAGYSIKLWDIEKKQVVKVYIGHGTEVMNLIEVPNRDGYFVSAAKGDRMLSVWSLNSKEKKSSQVASLTLQDPATSIQMVNFEGDMSTILYAVTEGGVLQVFKHKFNGTLSKPLKSAMNISMASEKNENKNFRPIYIHAVLPLQSYRVAVAYGSLPFLSFETISLDENQQENLVLVRQEKRKITTDEFNSKIKVPVPNENIDYQVYTTTPLKRGSNKQLDVPLEKRLENLALVNPLSTETPKKDNMAQLLLQGLQSKDKNILQSVLFRLEQSGIDTTVMHLPVQALAPLIRELTSLIHGKTFTSRCAVGWLQAVIKRHSGTIISNPELAKIFEPLLASIEARVAVLPRLLRLKGRLSIVTDQIERNMYGNVEKVNEPMFTYQEQDSSDEGDIDRMSEGSPTDSEDNWDEYSELGEDKEEDIEEK